eukprot:CAMPEP_0167796808 /NCGR_PEP_ID=MMETSP0111_2-20121227/15270_1 /TAXON_ID=91324 /ORGANISM="Lotharella globosa, Strain CCCM811" /LENGTH=403 /DNA_ID=CAMNT_0007690775 /DNA_START=45 /DNA_END=1252 /DNA_ORIENTATION=+
MFLGFNVLLAGVYQLAATNNPSKRITLLPAVFTTLTLLAYWVDPSGELGIYPCNARLCLSKLPLFAIALSYNEVARRLTVAAESAREQSLKRTWLGKFSTLRIACIAVFGLGIVVEIICIALLENALYTLISYVLAYPVIAALIAPGVMAPLHLIRCMESVKSQAIESDASIEVQNAIQILNDNKQIMRRTIKACVALGALASFFVTLNVIYVSVVASGSNIKWCNWVFSSEGDTLGNPDVVTYILLLVYPLAIIIRGWVPLDQCKANLFSKEVKSVMGHRVVMRSRIETANVRRETASRAISMWGENPSLHPHQMQNYSPSSHNPPPWMSYNSGSPHFSRSPHNSHGVGDDNAYPNSSPSFFYASRSSLAFACTCTCAAAATPQEGLPTTQQSTRSDSSASG